MKRVHALLIIISFCSTTKALGHLTLTGPDHDIFAYVGEEVVLDCSLDFQIPTESLAEVKWIRTDTEMLVLLYQDGEVLSDSSHEQYLGRTAFLTTEFSKGNLSLRLKDVRTEDIGEYMCQAHTNNLSGNTTVTLSRLGFSSIQCMVFVLCAISLLLSVGLWVPQCKNRVAVKEIKRFQIVLTVCQNISISCAFIFWGVSDGFLEETATCAVINMTRFLLLMKVALFPENMHLCRTIQDFAIPVQYSAITMMVVGISFGQVLLTENQFNHITTNSFASRLAELWVLMVVPCVACIVIISLGVVLSVVKNSKRSSGGPLLLPHNLLFIGMELGNICLLGQFINYRNITANLTALLSAVIMGLILSFTIQTYCANEFNFLCSVSGLTSSLVLVMVMSDLTVFVVLCIIEHPRAWMLMFESVAFMVTWGVLIFVLYRCKERILQWRGCAYILSSIVSSILIPVCCIICVYYIAHDMGISGKGGGRICTTAFIHTLATASLFEQLQQLPEIPHTLVCVFEASGLTAVNAITLAAVLFQKSTTGERPLADLRTVLLPFEWLVVTVWLALQIHQAWKRNILRVKNNFRHPSTSQDIRMMNPMIDIHQPAP